MTNRNSSCRNKPFLLQPAGKDYLWGGRRLKEDFGKELPLEPLAETWECSAHPDGTSIVASGEQKGKSLRVLLREHPEYLGTHPRVGQGVLGELPILIKLIDAKEDLSVQVHPDDDYAREYENGSLGKTEMWYVLDASEGTTLVYGFLHDMSREILQESLKQGTIEKYLQKVKIKKGDVFYIEAGTVHAIGAGALIAEIQENSNLTYRMYDYNRLDKDGNPRALHMEKALQVINMKGSAEPRQPMRMLKYQPGCAMEFLCRCKYFQIERLLVNTKEGQKIPFQTGENSFEVLLCNEKSGKLEETEESTHFGRGDCIFIPADSVPLTLTGQAQLLKVSA